MGIAPSKDEIYHILEDEIITLKLLPGETLTENELCERFHVSRTPIRGALQRLQDNYFLNIVPHKSTTVTAIDLQIATQLIYGRVAVESMVIRDFINTCTPTDKENVRYQLQCLEKIENINICKKYPEQANISEFLKQDRRMHEVWFRATGKSFLWTKITRPDPNYLRLMYLDILKGHNIADIMSEHRELMEIIDTRAAGRVEDCVARHLYGGIRRIGSRLFSDEYRKYFGTRQKT